MHKTGENNLADFPKALSIVKVNLNKIDRVYVLGLLFSEISI